MIFKFFRISVLLLFISLFCVSCGLFGPLSSNSKHSNQSIKKRNIQERIFFSTYDKVWRAAQLSLEKYPLLVNSRESGELQTGFVKKPVWRPPNSVSYMKKGVRYQLRINILKGSSGGQEAVRVQIEKIIKLKKSFFSGDQIVASTGFEEKAILYRIGRELEVDKSLIKSHKESN